MADVKKQKPARYYEDKTGGGENENVDRKGTIHFNNVKKEHKFDGDVITMSNKEKWNIKKYRSNNKNGKKKKNFVINPAAMERHSRGPVMKGDGVKTNFFQDKLKRREILYEFAQEQAARTEILLNENEGLLEADVGETTCEITQSEIVANVDISAASKHFNLNLEFGPYRMNYTKNGRHLLLGGRKGHVAAFDWVRKKLHCEINVMEEVADVAWLHIETMFAVAQKNWVHFYDNQGIELHCIKRMNKVNRMEFLPYHFLLATANDEGYLAWVDVSVGELISTYCSDLGRIRMMAQNPANGVLCIGNSKGVVSMWSPNVREPLAKMLCHSVPLTAVTVDPKGNQMATAGLDKTVKLWDIRALSGPISIYKLRVAPSEIQISQKGLLAFATGGLCEVYKQNGDEEISYPYLRKMCNDNISGMQFCPYEDILGVSTAKGFTSLIVPGSGEPNFDAREANPFQTKSQRREYEIHALLEKIPAEFIHLDPNKVAEVDVISLKDKIDAKKKLIHIKPPTIDFEPRNKTKKGGSVKKSKSKKIVQQEVKRKFVKEIKGVKEHLIKEHTDAPDYIPLEGKKTGALDRFRPKKKNK